MTDPEAPRNYRPHVSIYCDDGHPEWLIRTFFLHYMVETNSMAWSESPYYWRDGRKLKRLGARTGKYVGHSTESFLGNRHVSTDEVERLGASLTEDQRQTLLPLAHTMYSLRCGRCKRHLRRRAESIEPILRALVAERKEEVRLAELMGRVGT